MPTVNWENETRIQSVKTGLLIAIDKLLCGVINNKMHMVSNELFSFSSSDIGMFIW